MLASELNIHTQNNYNVSLFSFAFLRLSLMILIFHRKKLCNLFDNSVSQNGIKIFPINLFVGLYISAFKYVPVVVLFTLEKKSATSITFLFENLMMDFKFSLPPHTISFTFVLLWQRVALVNTIECFVAK